MIFVIRNTLYGQTTYQQFDQYFSTSNHIKQFNGNALVAENKKVVYIKSIGFADFDTKKRLTENSQFPIASITKIFTSTAILQLKQKGRLRLDDPVKTYLPDFPYTEITIRQLLSNTSGLAQYYNLFDTIMFQFPEKIITNRDIIPTFIQYKTPLQFTPGEKWDYNNVNFCIAALIIEKITELSYQDYIKQNIFEPSNMKNSVVPINRKILQKNQVELYSFPNRYSTTLKNVKTIPENFRIDGRSNFYGNGGIVSTSEDLYKFVQALFSGKLIDKEELNEAFTPAKLNNGNLAGYKLENTKINYGLGWEMYDDEKDGKIVFHDGSITGLTSILAFNITKKQTLILLENTGNTSMYTVSNTVFNILNGISFTPPAENFVRQYGNAIAQGQFERAEYLVSSYQKTPKNYSITESEMNKLGYQLLRHNKKDAAISVFRTTTKIFPESWNAFDSYAEALLANGQKTKAIKMYQKSLELNPNNENGKQILLKINSK
ncbi:serine hydrolase domain-containing protein [Rhizosphaericola mali]|uniref:serine hydrolase domain-containing protein n=1 Tax=Rhizosphaericola mali TaxID=2545455 RepID=UPI001785B860|nr:serine hydrolase domain-containing protein [Rhizosphaericola mali]